MERPDISSAKKRMSTTIGANREIKKLPDHLWEGEQVQMMASGFYGAGVGLVVLTDRRLLFVKDGVMSKTSEDFPIEKISSVQWSSGMLQGSLIVFASGNKAEIKQMDKTDGKLIADTLRNRLAHTPPPPAAPVAAVLPSQAHAPQQAAPDIIGQLRQLGELRDAGVLTTEEFDAKKAELLARL